MDLQDYTSDMLYFHKKQLPEVASLVKRAAQRYDSESEEYLLKALSLDQEDLVVLIGLYRFYFYQHRYLDALRISARVMSVVGSRVGLPNHWQEISKRTVNNAVLESFCLVRLYFFALKAAGYINLRLNRFAEGKAMLEKVVEMDSADKMGAKLLLKILGNNSADVVSFPGNNDMGECQSCQTS